MERLLAENNDLKARLLEAENRRFAQLAQEYAGSGPLLLFEEGLSPDGLRRLCDAVSQRRDGLCACFSGGEGEYKYAVARRGGEVRELGKAMNAALQGRGGGKPDFIQGSVRAAQAEIEAFFSENAR